MKKLVLTGEELKIVKIGRRIMVDLTHFLKNDKRLSGQFEVMIGLTSLKFP
jgi:hypothetical protein